MDDLVQFLRERLAAELESIDGYDGSWNDADGCWGIHVDPAFTRADMEAKRQIVDAYLPPGADPHPGLPCINYEGARPEDFDEYDSCSRHLEANKRRFHSDYVLRLLALPYADHPDYREEWKP